MHLALKKIGSGRKGGGKGAGSSKQIKSTQEGVELLTHLKDKSEKVMEHMKILVGGEVSSNSMIGCSAELCIGAGLSDKGRALLNFRFKDSCLGTQLHDEGVNASTCQGNA